MSEVLLLADIGGTHVRFAIYNGIQSECVEKYRTRNYFTFEEAVSAYLEQHHLMMKGMIIGAAGIRQNNRVQLTNCPWVIDTEALKSSFKIEKIVLLNDFSLQGLGVLQCKETDFISIGEITEKSFNSPCAVIGAGTGLGVCFLIPDSNNRYQVFESEGGHITAGGVTPAMRAIIEKAAGKLPHVSYERFVSGTGLLFLYQIIGENYAEWAHNILSEEIIAMQQAWHFVEPALKSDRWVPVTTPPEITALAEQGNEIALMTYWLFFEFLGVFCADMALTFKTTGGIYLVGDLLAHHFVSELLPSSYMRKMFEIKGRFSRFTQKVPVQLVTCKDIPIGGLTHIAQMLWEIGRAHV